MCGTQDQLNHLKQRPLGRKQDARNHSSPVSNSRMAHPARSTKHRAGYTGAMRRSPKSLQPVVSWYSDFLEEKCAEHERLAAMSVDAEQGFLRPVFRPVTRAPVPAPSPIFPIPYHKVGPLQPISPTKKRTPAEYWSNQHSVSYWSTWQSHPGLIAPSRLINQTPTTRTTI
ncbi:hypothetical protein BCR37DRAFT_387318 [Protomyces lactucae-debilis]|uniref:Uncharacterized protein n=1 Tax=Protomyces lactucae-debilis TaxID=2754530 RepID=A0A1Y2FG97_PROLT|nr:uncharacterized protein BCR37DRAFT_387318 [Protomyces lactucae-debilis]ORY82647.1 hypothetical protein BCR37DRAFT_387318 [Protomyces lactucae-debilis]